MTPPPQPPTEHDRASTLNDHDHALAAALLTVPGIVAVLLGGSRASGLDDAASDTDLYALRRGPLAADEVRAAALAPLADDGHVDAQDIWGPEDRLHISGRLVEVMHLDLDEIDLDSAHNPGLDPNGYTTAFLFTLANGVIVADPAGELAEVQRRLADYPEATARRILAHAPVELAGYLDQLSKAQRRGDWASVLHRRTAWQTLWFDCLFALNRRYHPGEKRMVEHAEGLDQLPHDFGRRWRDLSMLPGTAADLMPQSQALTDDLLALASSRGQLTTN